MNYYGTDPNYLLTERLCNIADKYKEVNNINPVVDIRSVGSEIYQSDWENKIGLAFSSPPYYCLEDYGIGDQSYKPGVNYTDWLNNYFKETIKNIHRYLIDDGILAINVNNFKQYDLVGDCKQIILDNGFTFIENCILENIKRPNSNGGFNNNNEGIMIFRKVKIN